MLFILTLKLATEVARSCNMFSKAKPHIYGMFLEMGDPVGLRHSRYSGSPFLGKPPSQSALNS